MRSIMSSDREITAQNLTESTDNQTLTDVCAAAFPPKWCHFLWGDVIKEMDFVKVILQTTNTTQEKKTIDWLLIKVILLWLKHFDEKKNKTGIFLNCQFFFVFKILNSPHNDLIWITVISGNC